MIAGQAHEAHVNGNGQSITVKFGTFNLTKTGYEQFQLSSLNVAGHSGGDIEALVLDGPAAQNAHFNLDPRRNAARRSSVLHHARPALKSRSSTMRRRLSRIPSRPTTWRAASAVAISACRSIRPRSGGSSFPCGTAARPDGEGPRGSPREKPGEAARQGRRCGGERFGNEGTGGHSHLIYPWRTGRNAEVCRHRQSRWRLHGLHRLLVSSRAEGMEVDRKLPRAAGWQMAARALFLQRELRQSRWAATTQGALRPAVDSHDRRKWQEITEAGFSCDATGKENRLDRFMGVERGLFFLSNGGFIPGYTRFGEKFTRPSAGGPPDIQLPLSSAN